MQPYSPLDLDTVRVVAGAPEPGLTRIAAFGELDASAGTELEPIVRAHLRQQPTGDVEVDLAGVTFLDSGGIRILLNCLSAVEQAGCRLRLSNPNPVVRRVLEITGLLEYFGLPAGGAGSRLDPPEAASA